MKPQHPAASVPPSQSASVEAVGEEIVDLAAPQRSPRGREIDEAATVGLGEEIGQVGLVGEVPTTPTLWPASDVGLGAGKVAPLRAAKRAGVR